MGLFENYIAGPFIEGLEDAGEDESSFWRDAGREFSKPQPDEYEVSVDIPGSKILKITSEEDRENQEIYEINVDSPGIKGKISDVALGLSAVSGELADYAGESLEEMRENIWYDQIAKGFRDGFENGEKEAIRPHTAAYRFSNAYGRALANSVDTDEELEDQLREELSLVLTDDELSVANEYLSDFGV